MRDIIVTGELYNIMKAELGDLFRVQRRLLGTIINCGSILIRVPKWFLWMIKKYTLTDRLQEGRYQSIGKELIVGIN